MMHGTPSASEIEKEKSRIALTSVIAAVFLTTIKIIIGVYTGSLGILSEAAHSGLDLLAALITYFAVRIADKPADTEHHFGHGKIENFSALAETFLLLITCVWIIYEAVRRIFFHEVHVEFSVWGIIVIITSIVVDYSRSKALMRVAKKYNSQALEADALHFSTDIWSSAVVLIGLIGVYFKVNAADSIAALIVAFIVIGVSYRLGKRSFDDLIDRAPEGLREKVASLVKSVSGITDAHDIKIRNSGSYLFVDLNVHVDPTLTIEEAHNLAHKAEDLICKEIERCKVHIHLEPDIDHH